MKLIAFVPMVALASGCAVFSDPNKIRVINGDGAPMKAAFSQADKRAVFFFSEAKFPYACPEPSPDVMANVEAAVKGALDASVKQSIEAASKAPQLDATAKQALEAAIKADLDANRKLVMTALMQRSQGLQAMRDLVFQACLARIRNDITPAIYQVFLTDTLPRLGAHMIAVELIAKNSQADGRPVLSGRDLEVFLNYLVTASN